MSKEGSKETLAQQWHQVDEWRRRIEHRDLPPSLAQDLDTLLAASGDEVTVPRTLVPPFAALMFHHELRVKPPLALVLAVVDAWVRYTEAKGKLTLEECLLGPPVRRAGNYSARLASYYRSIDRAVELDFAIEDGKTVTSAAEDVAETAGVTGDWLRKSTRGYRKRRQK